MTSGAHTCHDDVRQHRSVVNNAKLTIEGSPTPGVKNSSRSKYVQGQITVASQFKLCRMPGTPPSCKRQVRVAGMRDGALCLKVYKPFIAALGY